jgi:hypothetical protein
MIDIINYEETDNTDDKVEQQYINEAIKIIMAHLFMCVDDLKDKGFTYDDFKDYI